MVDCGKLVALQCSAESRGILMKLFERLDVFNDFASRSATINMAIDEALLEVATIPSIRFYRWSSPALSFGYFERFADVAPYAAKRDLVRRWTGGGIVFHGDDLTYSIIIPARDGMFAESSAFIYAAIHSALCDALNIACQRAELAPAAEAAITDPDNSSRANRGCSRHLCFVNPVSADVMIDGRKIAGAAQRRTRAGLLHQGSIQNVDLGNGLAERFASELSADCVEQKLDDDILNRVHEIAARKYETADWLQRR